MDNDGFYYHEEKWDLSMLSGHPNFDEQKWRNNSHTQLITMSVRAKFKCNYATIIEYPVNGGGIAKNKKFNFSAIYGRDGENASFSKATPSGTLEIVVDEGTSAFEKWKPGKEYYLDFSEVPMPQTV